MREMMMSKQIAIIEPMGRAWSDEIVYLPCGRDVTGVKDEGTGKLLPSQRTQINPVLDIAGEPQLAVRLSLAPSQKISLGFVKGGTASPGNSPLSSANFAIGGMPAHVFSNGCISVAAPCSRPFNADETLPGPLLAVRRVSDKEWTGRGTMGVARVCGRITTEILDNGPLFIRWQIRYLAGGRELVSYIFTLFANEDFVRVQEKSSLDAGMDFRFAMDDADAPQFWCTHGGGEFAKVTRGPVASPPTRMGLERPGEFIHIDFHCGHFQISYAWAGLWRDGGPLIGVTEMRGGHWKLPGRNRITVKKDEKGLSWHFPANGGSREYAFVCGIPEAFAPEKELSRFCHLRRKYSDMPLEKIRHWKLDWDIPRHSTPILYPKGTADSWKKKAAAWPELIRAYRKMAADNSFNNMSGAMLPAYLITGDKKIKDDLLKAVEDYIDVSVEYALGNGYIRLIIFSGRNAKVALDVIDVLRANGELDEEIERRLAKKLAFLSYCFADPDFWPWDSMFRERNDPRSHGGVYWDDAGSSICPPNFTSEYYTSTGIFALAYPEHPMAQEWISWSTDLFERNLEAMFFEGGSYEESANYHNHTLGMITQLAVALLAGGHRDFFEHPRFKANFGYFVENLTPRVALTESGAAEFSKSCNLQPPSDGKAVYVTNWGNSGHDCSGYPISPSLPVAAGIYADRDLPYARRLMTAWRLGTQQFCSHYWGFDLLAVGRPDLKDIELNLESKILEGTGVAMRAAQGTEDEVFAWIKCGPATHHNCNDEGGIVLYAKGAPILGDFGYHTHHAGKTEGGFETWKHCSVTFGGKNTSFYLGVEQALPPKFWQSTAEADLLVCDIPIEYLLPEGARYDNPVRVPRIDYKRSILFVKPNYFVVYDQISKTSMPSTWWLHALAKQIDVSGSRAYCHGMFGVDLDVQIVQPAKAVISTGEYSVQRHIRIEQPGAGDYLAVLTPLRKGGKPPAVEFDSSNKKLTVKGSWGTDIVQLGGTSPLQLLGKRKVR